MSKKPKLIRITTVPLSLRTLLKGQLRYMSQKGFEVIAVTSGCDTEDISEHEAVPVIHIEMTREITPVKDIKAVWKLYRFLRREKPDIIHTHTPKAGIVGMLAGWLTGIPLRLHTVAGMPLLVAAGFKRKLLNIVEKITYSFATGVYPNSKGLYDIILSERFTSLGKLKVLGNGSSNGIDTSYFDPSLFSGMTKKVLKDEYGIKESDFVFIFIGRVVSDKGINELVHAFQKLSGIYKHAKLLIVGDFEKELDPLLKATDDILQNSSSIILTGFQKDVRPFLSISDVLVFPSYREGFPNVVMQSGAMGLPSIVSDINGCNEIIIDGLNGRIIPVKNIEEIYISMTQFLDDDALYQTMKGRAREMITSRYEQKVIWEAIHQEYVDLLDKANK